MWRQPVVCRRGCRVYTFTYLYTTTTNVHLIGFESKPYTRLSLHTG